jgi:outer membrane protein TolC
MVLLSPFAWSDEPNRLRYVGQPGASPPAQQSNTGGAPNSVNIVRPAGYVDPARRSFAAAQPSNQEPEPIGQPEVPPFESLPGEPGRRPPGSRTQAETVDAPPAIPAHEEFVIDLPTTVRLLQASNPTVGKARELIRETLALQTKARVILLPSLNGGLAYHNHEGNLIASTGQIKYMYEKSLYYGAGTRVWAAESLAVPGVRLFGHVGDAIYEPLAMRQQVAMRRFDSQSTANTLLLEAINRYFDLLAAEGRYKAARQTEREAAEIVRITASYAVTGQGREGDANRARAEAYLMHVEVLRAEERVAVASTRLAEILSLDPSMRLKTVGGPIAGIEIVDPNTDLQMLIRTAERRRPELMAASATIQQNNTRVRQEQMRPLLPMVLMGYSAGSFGGGGVLFPPEFGTFRGRQDFDVLALWSLTNMGVGNAATVAERRAVLNQSIAERVRALNGIRQEVIVAYALMRGELVQIQVTQRQLADSEQGFREEYQRLLGAEALPIEVLNSVDQLSFSRQELIKAVTGYNQAQFRLFVATGSSPAQVSLPPSANESASVGPMAPRGTP